MKKSIYTITIIIVALLAHGQSPAENMIAAQAKVECAKVDLAIAQKELAATFAPFKQDARVQIKANDRSIADIRANLAKPFRSPANDASKQKIDDLENRNIGLRDRLYVNEE